MGRGRNRKLRYLAQQKSVDIEQGTHRNEDDSEEDDHHDNNEEEDSEEITEKGIKQKLLKKFFSSKSSRRKENEMFSFVWSKPKFKGQYPLPRHGHTMISIGSMLYVFGGVIDTKETNELWILDTNLMSWTRPKVQGTPPSARQHHSAIALPNKSMLIFGGVGGGDQVYIFDPSSRTWFEAKIKGDNGSPGPRWGTSMALIEQSILVIGGHDGNVPLDEVWELDLSSMSWKQMNFDIDTVPNLGPRHSSYVIPDQNKILVLTPTKVKDFSIIYTLEKISDNEWTWNSFQSSGKTVPAYARHAAAIVHSNILLLFGGVNDGKTHNLLFTLQIDKMRWNEPSIGGFHPNGRVDHTMAIVNSEKGIRCFLFGGHSEDKIFNDVHILMTLTWCTIETYTGPSPPQRIGHTCTMIDANTMVFIGGASDGKSHNDVRYFHFDRNEWEIPPVTGKPPKALTAHTCVCVGEELVIFGGGDGRTEGNGVAIYNTNSNCWIETYINGQPPQARYGHTSCLYDENNDSSNNFNSNTGRYNTNGSNNSNNILNNLGLKVTKYTHKMFVFGGYSIKEGYSNKFSEFDVENREWVVTNTTGALPEPRACHSMILHGGTIFIYGGSQDDIVYGDIHTLQISTKRWTTPKLQGSRLSVPYPRFNHSAALIGNKMYIFGGIVSHKDIDPEDIKYHKDEWRRHRLDYVTNELFSLDCFTLTWEKPVLDREKPIARFRHISLNWNQKLVILGGHKGGNQIYYFDTGLGDETYNNNNSNNNDNNNNNYIITTAQQKFQFSKQVHAVPPELGTYEATVHEWLATINLEKYSRIFAKSEIDWESLYELTNEDLLEMGILAIGPRKKILQEISHKKASLEGNENTYGGAKNLFLGRYRLEQSAGYGQSQVKTGVDTQTGKRVALSFFSDLEFFRKQISLLKELQSEFVVDLVDWHEDRMGKAHCIVVEYSNVCLETVLRKKSATNPFYHNERKLFLHNLGRIIQYFHSHSVVLCDLRLDNIYLFGMHWKVIDLSAAVHVSSPIPDITPYYCCPEVANGLSENQLSSILATTSIDMWAYAMIMIESYSYKPFYRTEDDVVILHKLQSSKPLQIPEKYIQDDQALNLLTGLTQKLSHKRFTIQNVLRHAYFCGGLDNEQMEEMFTELHREQKDLQNRLKVLQDIILQKKVEAETTIKAANQQRQKNQ